MQIQIHNAEGFVISTSKNLRGVLERLRKFNNTKQQSMVAIIELPKGEGTLKVIYPDGSYVNAHFASFKVLKNFVTGTAFRLCRPIGR